MPNKRIRQKALEHQRFVALMQHTNQIMIGLNEKYNVVEFNKVAERIYGVRRTAVLKKNYFDALAEKHLIEFTEADIKKANETEPLHCFTIIKNSRNKEYRVNWKILSFSTNVNSNTKSKKNPKEYWLLGEVRKNVQPGPQSRKKAESGSEPNFSIWESLLTVMPGNVYWKNRDGVYLGCNDNVAKAMGLKSRYEFIGKTIHQLTTKESAAAVTKIDEHVMSTGKPIVIEEKGERPGKKVFGTYLTHKVPIIDSDKQVIGLMGVSFDITPRKRLEAALKKAKAKAELHGKNSDLYLHQIVAALPGHVFWTDRKHTYLGCNKNVLDLMGFTEFSEFVGKSPKELFSPDIAKMVIENDERVMASGEPSYLEEQAFAADGSPAVYISVKVPIHDNKGRIIGLIGNAMDITKLKQLEEELKEAKQKAELANIAKSEFLAVVSHELRLPLTGILGMAQLLSMDNLQIAQLEKVEDILKAGNHLLTIVNDILDFAKLEADKFELYSSPINFKQLVEEVAIMLLPVAKSKHLELFVHYNEQTPAQVIADARALRQVVINLVGNAIKFTHKGYVKIEVSTVVQRGDFARLLLQVEDTGIGIPENKLVTVFDRFSQVDSTRARNYGGTGLGLTITKALVEAMGGSIQVSSQVEKGTIFSCELPFNFVISPLVEEKKSLTKIIAGPEVKKHYVLMVEDDVIVRKVHAMMLEKAGCKVDLAENANQALAMWDRGYNAIIMDIGLPHMDGFELATEIRRLEAQLNKKPVPIIGLTGYGHKEDHDKCLSVGMNDVAIKPIAIEALTTLLEKWVSGKVVQNAEVV